MGAAITKGLAMSLSRFASLVFIVFAVVPLAAISASGQTPGDASASDGPGTILPVPPREVGDRLPDPQERHPWQPNDAPWPWNYSVAQGSWQNSNGSVTMVYCTPTVASDNPYWYQENMRYTRFDGGSRCNVEMRTIAGDVSLWQSNGVGAVGSELATATIGAQQVVPPDHGSGWQAYGEGFYSRTSDDQLLQIRLRVTLEIQPWGTGARWNTVPNNCVRDANIRIIACTLWSVPFRHAPYACPTGRVGAQPQCASPPRPCEEPALGFEPNCFYANDEVDRGPEAADDAQRGALTDAGVCPRAGSDPVPPTPGGQEEPFNTDVCDQDHTAIEMSDPGQDAVGAIKTAEDPDSQYDRGPGNDIGPIGSVSGDPWIGDADCGGATPIVSQASGRKRGQWDIYKTYRSGSILLRYGYDHAGTGFGWRHIRDKHRWDREIDYCIERTLEEGNCKFDSGSGKTRCRKSYRHREPYKSCSFLVVRSANPARGGPNGPIGIVTAYFEKCWTNV